MVQTAITQVVKTLNDVHERFGVQRSPNDQLIFTNGTPIYLHWMNWSGKRSNRLYEVLQILKGIGRVVVL
jgi:hypothetical protein